jgi:UDP-3-O-[3-hydroxymyristoyl] glucosamine N-acyltransferase
MNTRLEEEETVYTLSYIAERIGGKVRGNGERPVFRMSPVDAVEKDSIVFIREQRYFERISDRKACSFVLDFHPDDGDNDDYILIEPEEKERSFITLLSLFEEDFGFGQGISDIAAISDTARIGKGVLVDAYAVVEDGSSIGENTRVGAQTYIGRNCTIGRECTLFPRVTIYPNTWIGDRVVVHSGVVVGGDGFGYSRIGETHRKIPQIGGVVIEHDVEIGANTTIDRATLGNTRIGAGTKIDNLVQIAHNVEIGENSIVCALCGISGSVKIGSNVVLAGQVGLADHIEIEDDVYVLAKAGVMEKRVKRGRVIVGQPATDVRKAMEIWAMWPKLREMHRDLARIKKKLDLNKDSD